MNLTLRSSYSIERQEVARVVQITRDNLTAIVALICANGGGATGHLERPEYRRPARIRLKQQTRGKSWVKQDWRVASVGDWIVQYEDGSFERIKKNEFDRLFKEYDNRSPLYLGLPGDPNRKPVGTIEPLRGGIITAFISKQFQELVTPDSVLSFTFGEKVMKEKN